MAIYQSFQITTDVLKQYHTIYIGKDWMTHRAETLFKIHQTLTANNSEWGLL